jgi:hypothetical protein
MPCHSRFHALTRPCDAPSFLNTPHSERRVGLCTTFRRLCCEGDPPLHCGKLGHCAVYAIRNMKYGMFPIPNDGVGNDAKSKGGKQKAECRNEIWNRLYAIIRSLRLRRSLYLFCPLRLRSYISLCYDVIRIRCRLRNTPEFGVI